MINNSEELRRWFKMSGVVDPLDTCIGPLPRSRAALGRWSSDRPDLEIRAMHPHPGAYRLSLMLAPMEARIWEDNHPVWGGVIPANRFRICPPGEHGQWTRMSSCDIVNIFIPIALVDHLSSLRDDSADIALAANLFVPDRTVLDLVHKMLNAESMAGQLASEACDGLVSALVCYLLEHYTKPIGPVEHSGLSGVRLRRVLKRIAMGLGDPVPNAELAQLCGMSAAHFSREFRRAVGLPPHQYLMKLRLERASAALRSGDTRIVDIAQECGFTNASHFSRAFAAQFGVAPAQFRQQHRRLD